MSETLKDYDTVRLNRSDFSTSVADSFSFVGRLDLG